MEPSEDEGACPACGAASRAGVDRCGACGLILVGEDDDDDDADEPGGAGQGTHESGRAPRVFVLPWRDSTRVVKADPGDDDLGPEGAPPEAGVPAGEVAALEAARGGARWVVLSLALGLLVLPAAIRALERPTRAPAGPAPAAWPARPAPLKPSVPSQQPRPETPAAAAVEVDAAAAPEGGSGPEELLAREAARLSELGARPAGPATPAAFDPDAALEALARARSDAAWAAAQAAHRPLPAASSVHELISSWVHRSCDLDPELALGIGRHPHPAPASGPPPRHDPAALRLGQALLARDLLRALEPPGERPAEELEPHAWADREAARRLAELALRFDAPDCEALWAIDLCLDPLVALDLLACCGAEARALAATAYLERLPGRLDGLVDSLRRPAAAQVLATLRRLDEAVAWLEAWPISLPETARLVEARTWARQAARRARDRLRSGVLKRADGPLGVGRDAYALVLARGHGIGAGPEVVLARAAAAFDAAARRLLTAADAPPGVEEPPLEPLDLHDHLARTSARLVAPVPASWERSPIPGVWRRGGEAYYLPAGPLAPPGTTPRVLVDDVVDTGDPRADALARRHVMAHELVPGHHLQFMLARESACLVRNVYSDDLLEEGWAVLAEELVHAEGGCDGGPTDVWLRDHDELGVAEDAALEVLAHAGWLDAEQLLALLRLSDPDAELADVGDLVQPPGARSAYFLGAAELRRLRDRARERDGAAFDARAFHERLLRLGPLPPALLERELAR